MAVEGDVAGRVAMWRRVAMLRGELRGDGSGYDGAGAAGRDGTGKVR